MTADSTALAALLGSRICHDLISPLGAIGNGVELLMMSGAADGPEIALISESVVNANARIRFFRLAYGAAAAGQIVARAEIASILADITRGGRLIVDWQAPGDAPRCEAKIAFLLIQCIETAMPYGCRISIGRAADRWHIEAAAERTRIDPALWSRLRQRAPLADLPASQVQFALARDEIERAARQFTLDWTEHAIKMSF